MLYSDVALLALLRAMDLNRTCLKEQYLDVSRIIHNRLDPEKAENQGSDHLHSIGGFNYPTFFDMDFSIRRNFDLYGRATRFSRTDEPNLPCPESLQVWEMLSTQRARPSDDLLNSFYNTDYATFQIADPMHKRECKGVSYYVYDMNHVSVADPEVNAKLDSYIEEKFTNANFFYSCLLHDECVYSTRQSVRNHLFRTFYYVQCTSCPRKCRYPGLFRQHVIRYHGEQ